MENIYHDYWQQELMYQFLVEDKCKKKAYVCSPYSAENNEGMLQNMRTARAYMFYALKKMGMCARAPHAFLPMLLCDSVPSERAIALKFGIEFLKNVRKKTALLRRTNRLFCRSMSDGAVSPKRLMRTTLLGVQSIWN